MLTHVIVIYLEFFKTQSCPRKRLPTRRCLLILIGSWRGSLKSSFFYLSVNLFCVRENTFSSKTLRLRLKCSIQVFLSVNWLHNRGGLLKLYCLHYVAVLLSNNQFKYSLNTVFHSLKSKLHRLFLMFANNIKDLQISLNKKYNRWTV